MATPADQARQAAVERLVARLVLDLRTHAGIEVSDHLHQTAITIFGRRSHVGGEERWAKVLAPS